MYSRPEDLDDDAVAATLRRGWGIAVDQISHAAVGFGSHHWHATRGDDRWFLTVDDLDARSLGSHDTRRAARHRLDSALRTARVLRERGRSFVVAPIPTEGGSLLDTVDDRYVLAVYPHVDGDTGSIGEYATRAERFAVVDRLADIHGATEEVRGITRTDDFAVPSRDRLSVALEQTAAPWASGPFSERARALLDRHADAVVSALERYDDLVEVVEVVAAMTDNAVVTHGEPHRGNVINTTDGPCLIDWDTALLAPPERDLWALIDEDAATAHHYARRTGHPIDPTAIRLYRLWWDLCEVALYVAEFRSPHGDTADARTAWRGLERHLDPSRWQLD